MMLQLIKKHLRLINVPHLNSRPITMQRLLKAVLHSFLVSGGGHVNEINHDQTDVNKSFEEAGIVPDIDCYKCYSADRNDVELVYEAVINKPSLLNVGQLHDTYNPDANKSRWTLSFTLLHKDHKHCTFADAMNIFSESIDA